MVLILFPGRSVFVLHFLVLVGSRASQAFVVFARLVLDFVGFLMADVWFFSFSSFLLLGLLSVSTIHLALVPLGRSPRIGEGIHLRFFLRSFPSQLLPLFHRWMFARV